MSVQTIQLKLKHTVSRCLHAYADLRIGATSIEKHCHKMTDSILLTFDDYGSEEEVHGILAILKHKHVRAMFFLQGDWAQDNPTLVSRIAKEGHVVGNHTFSHVVLKDQPDHIVKREIQNGLPGPWLRPPRGIYTAHVRELARKMGYSICYWTIDSRDWTGATVIEMRHTILSELQPGAVILFHIHGMHTRELLPALIDDIRSNGFALTPFDEDWSPED